MATTMLLACALPVKEIVSVHLFAQDVHDGLLGSGRIGFDREFDGFFGFYLVLVPGVA